MKISGMVLSHYCIPEIYFLSVRAIFVGNGKRRSSQITFSEEHLPANGFKIQNSLPNGVFHRDTLHAGSTNEA